MTRNLTKIATAISLFIATANASHAQARIDPRLPDAPTPTRGSLISSVPETVPGSYFAVPPLRPKQKFEIAFHKMTSPSLLVKSAMFTSFDKGFDIGPDFGSNPGDVAKLYAYTTENLAMSYLVTGAVLPTIFHQDPRYFRKETGSVRSRVLWALGAEVVAYSDSGKLMPNYAHLIGFGTSAAWANVYLPPENVSFASTMKRYGLRFAVSGGFNLLREFDVMSGIKSRFHHHDETATQADGVDGSETSSSQAQ